MNKPEELPYLHVSIDVTHLCMYFHGYDSLFIYMHVASYLHLMIKTTCIEHPWTQLVTIYFNGCKSLFVSLHGHDLLFINIYGYGSCFHASIFQLLCSLCMYIDITTNLCIPMNITCQLFSCVWQLLYKCTWIWLIIYVFLRTALIRYTLSCISLII
jgi:hypothetical protein